MFLGLTLVLGTLAQPATPVDAVSADRTRIQAHLGRVLTELRARDVSALEPSARANRERLVQVLEGYRDAGVFPHNLDHPGELVPYFIDHLDTACAVGYLMIASGAENLARTIAARENNARVFDITTPGVGAWLDRNGLSIEEAARIQPSYCNCPNEEMLVCGSDGMTYGNECVATMCAGVDVAHEGPCESGSTGSDWPGATGGSSGGEGSTSGDSSTGDDSDGDDDKGCRVGGRTPWTAGLILPLLVVGRLGRRRS